MGASEYGKVCEGESWIGVQIELRSRSERKRGGEIRRTTKRRKDERERLEGEEKERGGGEKKGKRKKKRDERRSMKERDKKEMVAKPKRKVIQTVSLVLVVIIRQADGPVAADSKLGARELVQVGLSN